MGAYLGLRSASREPLPRTVVTVHNIGAQGLFDHSRMRHLGLPESVCTAGQIEFYGQISFLKSALVLADEVITVSPTHARELLTDAFGCGLQGKADCRAALVAELGLDPMRTGPLIGVVSRLVQQKGLELLALA